MKLSARIAIVLVFLIFVVGLFALLVNVSEALIKTKLCVDLNKSSFSHVICDLNSSYVELLGTTFEVGETSRIEVETLLDHYWVRTSQDGSGTVSDYYQFNARFLGPPVVFTFDNNDLLMDMRVGE